MDENGAEHALETHEQSRRVSPLDVAHECYTTGDVGAFRGALRRLLDTDGDVRGLNWEGAYTPGVGAPLRLTALA